MFKEYKLYEKKCNIYNELYNSDDINKILNISEAYLNNPIFILDTSYHIISRSDLASSITSSIDKYNDESYLVIDIINIMKKDKCIDNIYNSSTAFFHFSDQNLIFCGVRINNITISYICVLKEYRDFIEEDLELTNTLAQTISLQMQRDNLFINSSGLEEEYYLMDLLMNRIENLEYIEKRLQNIDFKLNKNILLIVIPFYQIYQNYRHNFALNQLINDVKKIFGNCISAYYEDKIIFMISKEEDEVISENTKENFLDFLKLNNLMAGISFIFENPSETPKFYSQAMYALELSEKLNIKGHMFYFEDYLEYYLFFANQNTDKNSKRIELDLLIHPLINKLLESDKKKNTELLKTLRTYLENNRNANNTAKKLNIHCSTFFYRYHKIEGLLNISLNDSDILFKLELSLKILKYKKHR
ncbi:helix-turn-helix domain-containing protein [Clostridium lacusfryxellense]|nr:helix-turn-helix domain-containing protein [Clostridium lacusfryxellense]